jgi:hypothetical protein
LVFVSIGASHSSTRHLSHSMQPPQQSRYRGALPELSLASTVASPSITKKLGHFQASGSRNTMADLSPSRTQRCTFALGFHILYSTLMHHKVLGRLQFAMRQAAWHGEASYPHDFGVQRHRVLRAVAPLVKLPAAVAHDS